MQRMTTAFPRDGLAVEASREDRLLYGLHAQQAGLQGDERIRGGRRSRW